MRVLPGGPTWVALYLDLFSEHRLYSNLTETLRYRVNLLDEIFNHLCTHPTGVSSEDIARRFFKFSSPDPVLAATTVGSILKRDQRFYLTDNTTWHAKTRINQPPPNTHLVAIVLLQRQKTVYHLSSWSADPDPQPVENIWIRPLPDDQMLQLRSLQDEEIEPEKTHAALLRLQKHFEKHTPLFLNQQQAGIFLQLFSQWALFAPDHYLSIDDISDSTEPIYKQIPELQHILRPEHSEDVPLVYCRNNARVFSEWVQQQKREKRLRQDVYREKAENGFNHFEFKPSDFPTSPGVYAFHCHGQILYIGKAKNLRRRLTSYIRRSAEQSAKVVTLKKHATSCTVVQCGSELEALITELKLIQKHSPQLNTVQQVGSSTESNMKPLQDGIMLLPHVETQMAMAVLLRVDTRVVLKSLPTDFSFSKEFIESTQQLFYGPPPPARSDDFELTQIVQRYLRSNRLDIVFIPAASYPDASALTAAIESYWPEVPGAQAPGS